MCLSLPGKVIFIDGDIAKIDYEGDIRAASVALKPDVSIGDYVIVSAKMVMEKVPEHEALKTIEMWDKTDKNERDEC